MISVIVCSHNEKVFQAFEKNIADTIGTPYEIIRIDNSHNAYSLCSAYNTGAAKARNEILCFAHEDVLFRTRDWGATVTVVFQQNPRLGLLGVAGSTYKSHAPASWSLIPEARRMNVRQHYKYADSTDVLHYENPRKENLAKVVCVDGVWMCTKREIASAIKFDQATFTGFHCYDLDFSLKVYQQYDVAVTFEILLEHFSEGRNDKAWIMEYLKFFEKWKENLPVSIYQMPDDIQQKEETRALSDFVTKMSENGFLSREILKVLQMFKSSKYIENKDLKKMKIRIIKEFIKKSLGRLPLRNSPAKL